MRLVAILAVVLLSFAAQAAQPAQKPYAKRDDVQEFVRQMAERHGFVEHELRFLFSRARREPAILAAIVPAKDAAGRSWLAYRTRFVSETRIAEGAEFWRRHAAALERAARNTAYPRKSSSPSSASKRSTAARWAAGG